MKSSIALLLVYYLSIFSTLGQEPESFYKWEVSAHFAYEQHDMRIWEPPGWSGLHEKEYGTWGTYWHGASLHKTLLQDGSHLFKLGLGYASEVKTLRQRYNARKLLNVSAFNDALHLTNRYKVKHLLVPVNYSLRIINGLWLNANISTDFSFFKRAANRSSNGEYYKGLSHFKFDFYSVSVYPGLQYNLNRFSIRFDYRVLQWKKIDQVIPADRFSEKMFETYNPAHLRLTVSYAFGKKKVDTKNVAH